MLASLGQVVPFYLLEKDGGFRKGDQRGVNFATGRLALGAQFARDMIYDARRSSAEGMVGYPMVNVRDIESEKVPEVTTSVISAAAREDAGGDLSRPELYRDIARFNENLQTGQADLSPEKLLTLSMEMRRRLAEGAF